MKAKITLLYYTDPGHGWLRVPLKTLTKLGIADKITSFSYKRTEYAYLEEDQDMTTFLLAMNEKGVEVARKNRNTNRESRIRKYESYTV
jgi:hypothetical protein